MAGDVKQIIVVAGPNGAGKTSFANEFEIERQGFTFVNADEIAWDLRTSGFGTSEPGFDIRAGRIMLEQIDALIAEDRDFVLETTLSSKIYAHRIRYWRTRGYVVGLNYLRLPDVAASIARVRRRVEAGGHDIPETTLRRRFNKSLQNLDVIYKPIVNWWAVWDSLEGDFRLHEEWSGASS